MVKDKQNSGAQNRNIKKRKLINEAANDKTQTKLFFKPITQSSSILNNKNSLCNNIEDNVVIETIINNKVTHTVQEENDNLINSIDNTSDKINHDVESMSSDSYLNCDGVSNKDNLMDLSAAEQYLEQSCNSESFNDDNTYNFETLADTAAFMAPSIEDSFKSKLKFLDQHPIQPIIFNHKKVHFDPKKLYNRQMANGEIVERKWISYQFYTNKIFCSTCMAFSKDILNSFVKGIFVNLKTVYNKVLKHEKSVLHKDACETYLRVCTNNTVDVLLGSMYDKEIQKNRMVIHRVVDIIIVLAKQNLAFRGHRYESITNLSNNQDNLNHGNFLALVKLVAKYDQVLNVHIEEIMKKKKKSKSRGRGNLVTFLSKTTVNKIIRILGEQIQNSIVKEVTYSGQFSLEIDSTQDVSVVDQLTVCLRYVYKGEIKERLLKMIPIQFSTGEAQYTIVKSTLQSLGIDVKKIVGQSYDGAANMKGKFNGLQTHFKKDAPNSIFTHCHAHVLNLIIGDVTKCNIVSQNLFDLLQKTAVFFSESHKRTDVWKHILSINEKGSNKLRKLQKLGNTRWNSKDVALKTIFHSWSEDNNKRDRFFYLLISLHTLGYDEKYIKDTKMASEARALLMKWSSFENILEAFIYLKLFF